MPFILARGSSSSVLYRGDYTSITLPQTPADDKDMAHPRPLHPSFSDLDISGSREQTKRASWSTGRPVISMFGFSSGQDGSDILSTQRSSFLAAQEKSYLQFLVFLPAAVLKQ